MNNTVEHYLFLGLPKSGKTTYFSLMAQHLQNVANNTKNFRFRFLEKEVNTEETSATQNTSDFIDDCISRIKNQHWPKKTGNYDSGYSCELDRFFSFHGTLLFQKDFYKKNVIDYHDYPGEVFEVAFGEGENPTPDTEKFAEDMRTRIKEANGLFLVLDAEALFNDQVDKKQKNILTRLFLFIKKHNADVKIAIIFNKLELFDGKEPDFIHRLKKNYSNVYANLPYNCKFFRVYPLGSVCTSSDGSPMPPKKLVPRNLLDPVKWMIGLEKYGLINFHLKRLFLQKVLDPAQRLIISGKNKWMKKS